MITVDVQTTNYAVTATETAFPITVTADNSIFTITSVQENFTVTNVTPTITFTSDAGGISSWIENLTVTNILTVGSTASTGTFIINGLTYPQDKGVYGQVLYTNGTTNAAWVNLGELVFWELSEDLQTKGFNIVTGSAFNDPNPQLTIGSGPTLGGNNTATFKSFIKFDAVDGAQQLGNISVKGRTLFYNTVTFAGPTALNSNTTIGGTLSVSGVSTLGTLNAGVTSVSSLGASGNVTAASLTVNGPSSVQNVSISGGINQGGGINTFSGRVIISGPADITNQANISGVANFSNTVNVYNDVYFAHDQTLYGKNFLTTTATVINIGTGLKFPDGSVLTSALPPASSGIVTAGQGISTSTGAYGVIVSLLTATTATLGGVSIGENLTINPANGRLTVDYATTTTPGVAVIGIGLKRGAEKGQIDLAPATTSSLGGLIVGDYLTVNNNGLVSVNTATLGAVIELPIATRDRVGGVKIGVGLDINTSTGVLTADGATTSTIGGVIVGEFLTINTATDVLTVNTSTLGPVLAQSFSYTLPIATADTLGGIRVGDYLDINSSTGVLSVNTASLQSAVIPIASDTLLGGVRIPASGPITINSSTGDISIPFATKGVPVNVGTPGVVRVGANLVIDGNGVIDVLEAGASSLGVVKPGFGMTVSAGALNVNTATTARPGLVQVGTGLAINSSAVLSLDPANSYGNINLTGDMNTNGYPIRYSGVYPNSKLLLNTGSALLAANTQTYIELLPELVTIAAGVTTSSQMLLKTAELVVGLDIYNSQVQASAYYDYSGTGAAFFPANIKFSDDTIQRTAWRGYDQGLIV